MKKLLYFLSPLLFFTVGLFAQSGQDAAKVTQGGIFGTARGMAMGGAFGALGGDVTGVHINPAGIAVYRSSEIVGTLNFSSTRATAGDELRTKNNFDFDNIAFIGYFPLRNSSMPLLNFGFSYNKVKSFNREVQAFGGGRATSLVDYMAHISNRGRGVDPDFLKFTDNQDPFNTGAPWLSVLGYNAYLLSPQTSNDAEGNPVYTYNPILPIGEKVDNILNFTEKGSIADYDFSLGTTINNTLNLGMSLTLTNVYYSLASQNTENFAQGDKSGFDLFNWLKTEGAGVSAKFGLIYRPVNSIRIGLAYHTPRWFTLTDRFAAEQKEDLTAYKHLMPEDDQSKYESASINVKEAYIDYEFTTPDKWVISLAGVFGGSMIISADYELTDYRKMKFRSLYNDQVAEYDAHNAYIREDFGMSSTAKVGMEYRFTRQFSGRLGYAWQQSPYSADFKDNRGNALPVGSNTIYTVEGDTHYMTGGFGYRFSPNTYLDFALVYKTQKNDDLYPYPNVFKTDENKELYINAAPYSLNINSIRGLLTLGYKF